MILNDLIKYFLKLRALEKVFTISRAAYMGARMLFTKVGAGPTREAALT
jgi:hypothetical protein